MEKENKILCPTCKGTGFYRIPYHLTREEVHAVCEDCDKTGYLNIGLTPEQLRDKGVI